MKKYRLVLLIMPLLISLIINISYAAVSEQDFSKICNDLLNTDKAELNEKLAEAGISIENTTLPYIYEACSNLISTDSDDSVFTDGINDKKIKKKKEVNIKENKIIENRGKGRIKFNKDIGVDVTDVEENPNVYVDNNLIAINSEELPELNEPASLIIENLRYRETPRILYSNKFTTNREEITEECAEDVCFDIYYDPVIGVLSFNVSHFSSFTTVSSSCPANYTDCNGDGTGSDADGCENPYPKCSCLSRGSYYSCTNYGWFWNYDGKTSGWCFPKTSSWFGFGIVVDSTGEKGGFPDCSQSQYCCYDYYSDFLATCGNGVCDTDKPYYAEDNGNCPKDCYVGDNVCDTKHENAINDPNDCCTDVTQCNTIQYCDENSIEDCNIKKGSEITGTYNFKDLIIDSSATLKAADNVTINAENVKIYGKILVDGDLKFNLAGDFELYGVINGTKSRHTGFEVIGEERYYCAPGSAVDMSGDNGVNGAKGITGTAPTAGVDGTDGKDGKPITIDVKLLEGDCKFISNGGRGGDGGNGGSVQCQYWNEINSYWNCNGDPTGKNGGNGGLGSNGGTVTIKAKRSYSMPEISANAGDGGNAGAGGDGDRGPVTTKYYRTLIDRWSTWSNEVLTVYEGGDGGNAGTAGIAGQAGTIDIYLERLGCSLESFSDVNPIYYPKLSSKGGNGGNGAKGGTPSSGSGCMDYWYNCEGDNPGLPGASSKGEDGTEGGKINLRVDYQDNFPALQHFDFNVDGGSGGQGADGADGAYSSHISADVTTDWCYVGYADTSKMTDGADGTDGGNGKNGGSITISGVQVGESIFNAKGGDGNIGGNGGASSGTTGNGGNGGDGGSGGSVSLTPFQCYGGEHTEHTRTNTFSLNGGIGMKGGDAGKTTSCHYDSYDPGYVCQHGCSKIAYSGTFGKGGGGGDGGDPGTAVGRFGAAYGGKGGSKGKGGSNAGSECCDYKKGKGDDGADGVDKSSITRWATDNNCDITKTCLQYDFKIERIEPIQVVEGVDLVANKPMMVRVFPSYTSDDEDVINDPFFNTLNVKVKLTVVKEDGTKIPKEKSIPVKRNWEPADIKNGINTFNFFEGDIPRPNQKGEMKFYAEIDPDDMLFEVGGGEKGEGNEKNNFYPNDPENNNMKKLSVNKQTYSPDTLLKIKWIPLRVGTWYENEDYTTFLASVIKNEKFLKQVYPVDPTKVQRVVEESGFPNFDEDADSTEPIKLLILFLLHSESLIPFNPVDKYVGVTPPGWLIGSEGICGRMQVGWNDVALIDSFSACKKNAAAHELGHGFGLPPGISLLNKIEEYDMFPDFGLLATDGWCLDQLSGTSCGPRVNVDKDREFTTETIDGVEEPKFFSMMGNDDPLEHWIDQDDYLTLYGELTS